MSLLPFIVSLTDDQFDHPWADFTPSPHPTMFSLMHPQHLPNTPGGYKRNWIHKSPCGAGQCPGRKIGNEKAVATTMGKDGFQVCVDVHQFAPNEITVKTVNNSVVIEGKHEEKQDDEGFVSRHFVRRYQLPKEYDVQQVVSSLSSDGVLTVKAPPPALKEIEGQERVVQIQQTGPAHLSVKPNQEEAEKVKAAGEKME